MSPAKNFYLTTPLYYVNAAPHLGHAYTTVIADCLARYHRLRGDTVFFLTGTDEHGQKIQQAATAAGKTPKQFADDIVPGFEKLWKTLQISYDDFIRTTQPRHTDGVKSALALLLKTGDIYPGAYEGWYCVPDETFWPKVDFVDGKPVCPDCRRPVEQIKEKNYFFKLGKYHAWLKEYIEKNEKFIVPASRRNEVLGFLDQPLQDLCISRPKARLEWGIEMPSPPFEPGYVTYVWFDALLNYITAVGYPDTKHARWNFWPADLHLIGKDILRPHAVYWPIMLHAMGLSPAKQLAVHGWWLVEGEKMSKSRGNIVDPNTVVAEYGVDAYRYFLLREVPFGHDGTFSEEAMDKRYNSDLANDLGNLFFRTLTMIEKYFAGIIPGENAAFIKIDGAGIGAALDNFDFQAALVKIWQTIDDANTVIDSSKPWVLAKEGNTQKLQEVLGTLAQALRALAVWLWPFMPATSGAMWRQLGCTGEPNAMNWNDAWKPGSVAGQKIQKGNPLFPRREPTRKF